MQRDRGRPLGLVAIALAATLAYAAQWQAVEHQPAGGRGREVTITREDGNMTIYACVRPAGIDKTPRVYKSSNDGTSWSSVFAYPAGIWAVRAVPTNDSKVVYAGVSEEGIYKSIDGGENWSARKSGMAPADITYIEIAGSDPDFVYAAGRSSGPQGIEAKAWRSTNAGESWFDVSPDFSDPSNTHVNGLAVHPALTNHVLLCIDFAQPESLGGIYATTDGGMSWVQTLDGEAVLSLAVSQSNPSVVYAGAWSGVLKSTDGGQSWSVLQSSPRWVQSLVIAPDDEDEVYASSGGVWHTTNGGANWEHMTNGMWLTSTSRICMDAIDHGSLFVGESDAGVYRTTNGGANWQQVSAWTPCRDVRRLVTEENEGWYWLYDASLVVDITTNGGNGWVSALKGVDCKFDDMVHPAADIMLMAFSGGPPSLENPRTIWFTIARSTDRGFTWNPAYSAGGDPYTRHFYQFGVAPSDPERIYGAVVDGSPRIMRSTNCGANWVAVGPTQYTYNAVAVSPDNPDVVYFGCRNGQVVVSTDGGYTVQPSGDPLPSPVEIRRLVIGVGGLAMYAATPNGVYYRDNPSSPWQLSGFWTQNCHDIADLVMASDGSSLWATSPGPIAGPYVYVSYNGAADWNTETDGLPMVSSVYSLSFDNDGWLHAGTSVGVFTYNQAPPPPVGPDATYPNWGRKLARDPDNGILHLAYTGTNVVYYKQSTDGGTTWSTPEPVGAGKYPAVASLGLLGVPGSGPWVVYVTPQGSIMRAIRMSPGVWDQEVVFQATGEAHAGAPSAYPDVVAAPYVNVYVAYPVYSGSSPTYSYIYFNIVTQANVSQPDVVDGPWPSPVSCYGASVVANPAAYIHVCWIRGQSVYYSQRTMLTPWLPPVSISTPVPPYVPEPASNPSMEAWGDSVFCVWRGPYSQTNLVGEVYQRARWLGSINWDPTTYDRSQSPYLESDFPVMGTNQATFWHEEVTPANYDPWVAYLGYPPHYLFQTPVMSRYPHVYCHFPTMTSFRCDAVWTEQLPVTPPLYEVRFGTVTWPPGPSLGNGSEIASYYEAQLGQSTPSPYCVSRGGYGNFDSWNADTSGSALSYQLPYLDPRMVYKLRAILYHKGKESWDVDIRCDSGPWHRIRVGPNVPDTFWFQVPKELYKDARMVVDVARASGEYVSLAGLKLYQLEPEPNGREGVQSTAGALRTGLLICAPNPLSRTARVSYELGQAGSVELTVHDVSGRLVRRLANGYRSPGKYDVNWNATDDHGRRVPAGIYFLRFSAGGQVSSRRVTLVR